MNCQRFDDLLSDYLESTLSLPVRAQMDAHAATCARCAEILADVRSIIDRAGALPVLVPSRDLWPDVAARLEAPVIAITTAASTRRQLRMPRWIGLAAAAAVLVVATSLITREAVLVEEAPPAAPVAVTATPSAQPAESLGAQTASPTVTNTAAPVREVRERAAVTYGREIERLESIVRQRESALDPATLAIIQNSMRIIDSALIEARAALARDTASRFLMEQVDKTLEKKMELLRSVSLLAART
jgi:hypothetical protein